MTCLNEFEAKQINGWMCFSNLTGLSNHSIFYIRCMDKPWLPEDNKTRNAMQESYPYTLKLSSSKLEINEIRPIEDYEFISGIEPVTVELKIKTVGGAEQGKSICYYDFGLGESEFLNTKSNYHEQVFNTIIKGTYNIDLRCEDAAGNIARNSTSFKASIDDDGPRITRIFYFFGLKITTNEEAECRYMFTNRFDWENATLMTGDGWEHSTEWSLNTYYIQCEDKYGNKGGKIKVQPYNLI
jgi:hypothetical protein